MFHLEIVCCSQVFRDEEVVEAVALEAGGEDDGYGQVDLLVLVELLPEELLQGGEDLVVHDQLPLVHGHALQRPRHLHKPLLAGYLRSCRYLGVDTADDEMLSRYRSCTRPPGGRSH